MTKFPIREYIRYLKYIRRYSSHTIIAYQIDLRQFQRFYKKNIISIRLRDVVNWVIELRKRGFSHRSINRKVEVLKSFYRYHTNAGNCSDKYLYAIPKLDYKRNKITPISEQDLLNVLAEIDVTENRKRHRDLLTIELLYLTGCRAQELINIKKREVDYLNGKIKVIGKGNKERYLLLNSNVILRIKKNLDLWKGKNKGHFLICDNRGEKLYPMFLDRLIKRYFKSSVVQQKSAHVIRHAMATHLYNRGVKIEDIQRLLGHVFLRTSAQYIYIDKEILLRMYKSFHPKA